MAKQWKAQIHEEPSFGAPYPFAKVVQRVTAIARRSLQAEGRILHGCEITLLLRNDFAAFLYSVVDFLLKLPDICRTLEAENLKMKDHFAALRNQPFAAKSFRSPFCASTKSRIPRFHLRNGP
uniref:Uncharacterized protein n=1 Tax=Vitis vinifera TaxID=29760 RepID=A5AF99_VITVI|nr:hypothetical protein VITISV_023656 [Vitis vinifera]